MIMNTNSTNKENENPYGHLLDKYLDSNHVDWETRQEREEEAKRRYGHLIGFAKPDNSTLELKRLRWNRRKRERLRRCNRGCMTTSADWSGLIQSLQRDIYRY